MDSRTQERAEQWDSRPFSGGYDGLTDLAASEFSGAVATAGTWLFMLNGRIVGVVDGTIEDFENASGTVYEAPHPSLPLLCTMEAQGGETRAKYYTNETPLREVDGTLQDNSFTGYVELSENVLSGDYYAVYYGGRRMAAAYIGNAERLLTGDEAFERADDEVGIYEVRDVDIDVTDVPGTESDATGDSGGTSAGSSAGTGSDVGSSSVSDIDPASGTGSDANPVSNTAPNTELGAGSDTHAEPSADPTESAIESIDISGSEPTATADETSADSLIDDVAFDDVTGESSAPEETDEASGITTAEEPALDASSSGITAPESESDATDGDSLDATTDPGADADSSAGSNGSVADESVSTSFDEATAASTETDATSTDSTESTPADRSAVSDAPSEPTDDQANDDEQSSVESAESDDTERTSPDLAEVEAAAEQLDQNDISWTEDDVDSSADDAAEESEPTATGPTDESDAESEQQPDPEDERFEEEAQWRETRRIPSIDPDNTQSTDSKRESAASRAASSRANSGSRGQSESASREAGDAAREPSASTDDSSARSSPKAASTGSTRQNDAQGQQSRATERADSGSSHGITAAPDSEQQQRITTLTEQLETLQEQRDALVTKAEKLETERDQLRSENQELTSTVDRLQSRINELETELQHARKSAATIDAGSETPAASTQLPPQRALAETNLFVRYGSKSQPTLKTAHDGDADKNEVASNLQLEHHTSFDAADVAVDGDPYEEFLSSTMEYRFVDWLTETVLYEIRDTGNGDALADLYDAIPRIDRAELGASISLADDETEDVPDEVTFDVVAFDKMGNPLVVANLNDSRDPATQGMLEEMEEAASAVKANYPDLAASVVVTSSYFEPGALEVSEQATSGGFLSRGSKLSYVNLSRKAGYHLCLVESRSEGFHMNVPEL